LARTSKPLWPDKRKAGGLNFRSPQAPRAITAKKPIVSAGMP
jgi:hypothetical protein